MDPIPLPAEADPIRQKVLASAYESFAARGYDASSFRGIAARAGVKFELIKKQFKNKRGLYDVCVSTVVVEVASLYEQMRIVASGHRGLAEVMSECVRLGYRFARARRPAVKLLLRSLVDGGELDTDMRDTRVVPFLDIASNVLGGLLRRPAEALRLPIQSVVLLVVRYATSAESEREGDAPSTRSASTEDHVVESALRLLGADIERCP